MSKLSGKALKFMRQLTAPYNVRPLGVISVKDPQQSDLYSITITNTTIGVTDQTNPFTVDYVGKTIRQIVTELNATPFPVQFKALADVGDLKQGELIASGTTFPTTFDVRDRTVDGTGGIIRIKRWSVQYNRLTAMGIRPPYKESTTLPWWGRVEEGEFWQDFKGIEYKFGVPEYSRQVWSKRHGKPFKDVEGEPVTFLGKNRIQLNRFPLLWKNSIVLTSPSGDRVFPSSVVKDVDTINGVVYLQEGSNLPEGTTATYSYLENTYLYKEVNLNGHFNQNPFVLDKYILMYARPVASSAGLNRSRGIYHEVGESVQDAINSIQELAIDEPVALLGAFAVKYYGDIRDLQITDTRSYGGGLKEDGLGKAAEKKFPQSQFFFDIGREEGIPYPGAAAIVVDLPPELKEVMPVGEIKTRASKFMAAGVYPIFQFAEDKFSDHLKATHNVSDVSTLHIETGGDFSNITGFVAQGEAASIWNNSFEHLTGYLTSSYAAIDFTSGARVNLGETIPYVELDAGNTYSIKYIKSSPDATFTWEERELNGQWKKKTVHDTRAVPEGQLIGGKLVLDASLGYKEIRSLSGISPYYAGSWGTGFWNDALGEMMQITKDIEYLTAGEGGSEGCPSGYLSNLQEGTIDNYLAQAARVPPGTGLEFYKPYMHHYSNFANANFHHESALLSGIGRYWWRSTIDDGYSLEGSFPRSYRIAGNNYPLHETEVYVPYWDIEAACRLATQRINYYANNLATGINCPAVLYSGAAWLDGTGDLMASYAQSGAFQIARKCEFIAPYSGVATVFPDTTEWMQDASYLEFNTTDDTQYDWANKLYRKSQIALGGECNPQTHQDYYTAVYPRAHAAVYAAMTLPLSGVHASNDTLATYFDFNPLDIALSGIMQRLAYYEVGLGNIGFGSQIGYNLSPVGFTWVENWNRFSQYAASILDDTCAAIEYITAGNDEWAGLMNTGSKTHPHVYTGVSDSLEYYYDTSWTEAGAITWPIIGTVSNREEALRQCVVSWQSAVDNTVDYMKAIARKGGKMTETWPLLTRQLTKFVINSGAGYPYWSQEETVEFTIVDFDKYIDAFEECADAYVKGMFSEDGTVMESTFLGYDHGPFSGFVPRESLKMCADGIKMYEVLGQQDKVNKWQSIAEGIFRSTTGQYRQTYGYRQTVNAGNPDRGDVGFNLLDGLSYLLEHIPTGITTEKYNSLTGSTTSVFLQ